MKKYIYFGIFMIVFASCQEVYDPKIDETESCMVVDGLFCTDPVKTRVNVSLSGTFNKTYHKIPVSGLIVYIIDNDGIRIDLSENGISGNYITQTDLSYAAKVGKTYTLFIENTNGDVFKSSPQLVNECPEIEDISLRPGTQTVLQEDTYGDIEEVESDGIVIYSDTKAILPSNNYYLYRWYGYEEHHAMVSKKGGGSPPSYLYRHQPISQLYTNIISTGNADESKYNYLKQKEFIFIPKYTFQNYKWLIPDTLIVDASYFDGYFFVSEQYSLSADAFKFWNDSEDLLNASGKLFDPVASQINGNLSCVNDPDKLVLGVFYASDMKSRIDYLYVNPKNRTYCRKWDSMPELWLDTCSWSIPIGWVSPPI